MSRIGKMPIKLPSGTRVAVADGQFTAEGPKGKVNQAVFPGFPIEVNDGVVTVSRSGDSGPERSKHGLLRALLANAVQGVSTGFTKELEIQGIGYKAQVEGKDVVLSLGYSHPVRFPIPSGIQISVEKQVKMVVSGFDKQAVGQVAADLRSLRPPDVYKGKGVRYVGEVVRKKVGKTGAK